MKGSMRRTLLCLWVNGDVRSNRRDATGQKVNNDDTEYVEEEKRLDREWYGMNEGQDEYHNALSNISEEYTKRKEKFIMKDEKRERQIREQRVETPSHTGGVSEEAKREMMKGGEGMTGG